MCELGSSQHLEVDGRRWHNHHGFTCDERQKIEASASAGTHLWSHDAGALNNAACTNYNINRKVVQL
jgi:hypothetical protein